MNLEKILHLEGEMFNSDDLMDFEVLIAAGSGRACVFKREIGDHEEYEQAERAERSREARDINRGYGHG